jgi:hypothetical protein
VKDLKQGADWERVAATADEDTVVLEAGKHGTGRNLRGFKEQVVRTGKGKG